jgi:hypothetical protein
MEKEIFEIEKPSKHYVRREWTLHYLLKVFTARCSAKITRKKKIASLHGIVGLSIVIHVGGLGLKVYG